MIIAIFFISEIFLIGIVKLVIDKTSNGYTLDNGDKAVSYKPVSNWTGTNMDPDSVKKHYNTLKRAGFRDNKDVMGPWGF